MQNDEHKQSNVDEPAHKDQQAVSWSDISGRQNKRKRLVVTSLTTLVSVGLIVGVIFHFNNNGAPVLFGVDFFANYEETVAIDEEIAEGYSFALGTEPSDPTDYSNFSITPVEDEQLRQEFLDAINTSPAFEEVDSVYEVIDYDQFDGNGNISEQAMREIIATARAAEN